MNRRTNVVTKARQCELVSARPPADPRVRFDKFYRDTGTRQNDSPRETIRTCANDDGNRKNFNSACKQRE